MAFDKKVYNKKYRKENKEAINANAREGYEKNKEAINAKQRKYREENPEKFQKYEKKRDAKPKRIADKSAFSAKRRVKKLSNKAPKSWGPVNEEKIKEIYQLRTWLNKNRKQKYAVDHIKPVSRGGAHHQRNLRVVTESTNGRKSNKLDSECNFDIDYWVWAYDN